MRERQFRIREMFSFLSKETREESQAKLSIGLENPNLAKKKKYPADLDIIPLARSLVALTFSPAIDP